MKDAVKSLSCALLALALNAGAASGAESEPVIEHISPTSSIPGIARFVRIEGKNLKSLKRIRIYSTEDAAPAAVADVNPQAVSGEGASEFVRVLISLRPDQRAGVFKLQFASASKPDDFRDSGRTFAIAPANGFYVDCPLLPADDTPVDSFSPPGIACSQSLLDRKEASDIFGKRIAHMYLAVQVNIRNLSRDFNYVLHDVRLVIDGDLGVASRTRQLTRGVAEKGQVLDGRNLVISGITAIGTIAGGLAASSLFTKDFARATNIFQGPFRTAAVNFLPDFTVNQLNRLNDHGLSGDGIVIPKDAPAVVMAFASQRVFLSQVERDEFLQRAGRKNDRPALSKFQRRIRIQIAGSHVERVDLSQPRLTTISPSTGDALSEVDLSLTGANLDRVAKIRLRKAGVVADAGLKVSEDGARATAKITLPAAETYNVYLLAPNGSEFATSQTFSVGEQLPQLENVNVKSLVKGASPVKASFTVKRQDLIKEIFAVQNDSPDPEVKVKFTQVDNNLIETQASASVDAGLGEHVWHVRSASGRVVASKLKFQVAAPDPPPVLLSVDVQSLKAGGEGQVLTFVGERLDKLPKDVSLVALQNGTVNEAVKASIDVISADRIKAKVTVQKTERTGEHVWALKSGSAPPVPSPQTVRIEK